MSDIITIATDNTCLILGVDSNAQLLQYYYGAILWNPEETINPEIPMPTFQNYRAIAPGPVNMRGNEAPPALSTFGGTDNSGALQITHANGSNSLELVYDSHSISKLDGNSTLTQIVLKDRTYPLQVTLRYCAYQREDIIEFQTIITNNASGTLTLHSFPAAELTIRTHEFWTSDNTDALQRIFTQWGTNHIYPAIATANHVTTCPNHQTGRSTPLKFRFDVAMSGRLGLELNPADMDEAELDFVKNAVAEYKHIRPIVMFGDLYRLVSPYESDFAALAYVSEDHSRALLFIYNLNHRLNHTMPQIKMRGLDSARRYHVREINIVDGQFHSHLHDSTQSTDTLMKHGIRIGLTREYDSAVFEFTAV